MRKRLREDLLREKLERRNLEEINELKLRFFTNITHEFRSPLTMIINPVDKLINNEFRPAMKKELYRIKENADRVLSLINQILDFRKVTVKGITPNFKQGDIEAFLSKQVETFSAANQNNQQLILRSELSNTNFVFDSFILEKIVSNLISNACKFSPAGTEIVISLKHAPADSNPDGIILSVKDRGRGIPEQYLDKVFDRFFQVGTDISGSGIGLSLVHELVTTHKGTIRVESELNKGSCFSVFLPKIPLVGEIVENASGNIVLKSFKAFNSFVTENKSKLSSTGTIQTIAKYKILFIDDDEDLLSYLVEEFDSVYTTYRASNGKDAWELIHHVHPDLIVSDVNMPEMNGWELCNAVKSDLNYSHIPVILLTVDNSDESREQGYECGADSYLEKPISLNILHTRIQNILRTREKARIKYQKSLSLEPSEVITTSMDEQFLKKALSIVEKNIDNPDFNNDSFCLELGVSSTQLYKKLKSLLGLSASEFIKDIRLKRAAQLLKMNGNNISEVAYMCGFADPKYFSKCFKKQFGVNPKRFPKQYDKAMPV
ncbi:MAG: response regulator [Bacteroidales bacterium]|nr:response regulator [Bacteroidales bacterium]